MSVYAIKCSKYDVFCQVRQNISQSRLINKLIGNSSFIYMIYIFRQEISISFNYSK